MAKGVVRFIQDVINDDDLNSVTIQELRSILLHIQNTFSMSGSFEEQEDPDMSDEEYKKYIL